MVNSRQVDSEEGVPDENNFSKVDCPTNCVSAPFAVLCSIMFTSFLEFKPACWDIVPHRSMNRNHSFLNNNHKAFFLPTCFFSAVAKTQRSYQAIPQVHGMPQFSALGVTWCWCLGATNPWFSGACRGG